MHAQRNTQTNQYLKAKKKKKFDEHAGYHNTVTM